MHVCKNENDSMKDRNEVNEYEEYECLMIDQRETSPQPEVPMTSCSRLAHTNSEPLTGTRTLQ